MTKAGFDYLKEVEQQLCGKKAQKKAYLKTLSADVAERLEEEPNLDCAALALAFGSPEELATEFMETLDTNDVKDRADRCDCDCCDLVDWRFDCIVRWACKCKRKLS